MNGGGGSGNNTPDNHLRVSGRGLSMATVPEERTVVGR